MFSRRLLPKLTEELQNSPAVALLGPRQVGKTTLAREVARALPSIYLDLESERDRTKLAQAELYLADHLDKLVILDEVHRAPGLFPVLRGLIDQARRNGKRAGQYLLLGSASLDLLQQAGETLAGRIAYLELGPLNVLEIGAEAPDTLWLRGGFPESMTAPSDARSSDSDTSWIHRPSIAMPQLAGGGVASPKLHPQLLGARRAAIWPAHCSRYPAPLLDHAGAPPERPAQHGPTGAQHGR